ncbi:hypothetical protein PCI56_24235 [Plesiomonas shigelloides subsp. oncorhynchi]|nr:hypothetical protein [Plesiomonas shigelloides]
MAGPYLAYRLSDHWSVFGQATVGEVQHRYKLLALSGKIIRFSMVLVSICSVNIH